MEGKSDKKNIGQNFFGQNVINEKKDFLREDVGMPWRRESRLTSKFTNRNKSADGSDSVASNALVTSMVTSVVYMVDKKDEEVIENGLESSGVMIADSPHKVEELPLLQERGIHSLDGSTEGAEYVRGLTNDKRKPGVV